MAFVGFAVCVEKLGLSIKSNSAPYTQDTAINEMESSQRAYLGKNKRGKIKPSFLSLAHQKSGLYCSF